MKFFLLAVGILYSTTLLRSSEAPPATDYDKFEGTWKIQSMEMEGKKFPAKAFESSLLILKGKEFTQKDGDRTNRGTFDLDASKSPKQMDIHFTEGPNKGKTLRCIYELDGDTYKLCGGMAGKDRPTAFESKPKSGHFLEVLKREKPAAPRDADKKELAKLTGTWQLLSAETDGIKLADEQAKQIRVVIGPGKHTVYFGDKVVAEGIDFRIDATKSPKQVEDMLKDGRKIRGIYEVDGDTLRSCVAAPDKDRPTEFTGKSGSGFTLRVFQRVKP